MEKNYCYIAVSISCFKYKNEQIAHVLGDHK